MGMARGIKPPLGIYAGLRPDPQVVVRMKIEEQGLEGPASSAGEENKNMGIQVAILTVLATVFAIVFPEAALAADGGAGTGAYGNIALASGIAIGLAAIGAALGQGRGLAAAMESIGRNPNSADRIQTPMILGLAFIEALAIYALVIAFLLQDKIPGITG